MKISPNDLHDLTAYSARLSAVLSLLRDPESRDGLDAEQVNHDVEQALRSFTDRWRLAFETSRTLGVTHEK